MLKRVPHIIQGVHPGSYRTEDVRFSRCGRRLTLAATENRVLVYTVDVESRPIQVSLELELYSSQLSMPHGIDFVDDDLIVVANRNADLQFYRLSSARQQAAGSDLEPEYRFHSPWFGPLGATRAQRDREVVCGPGSVRFLKGRLFVCCNYRNTLSVHRCVVSAAGLSVTDESILAGEDFEIPDGVALSPDERWVALSDHDHNRVVMYRRAGGLLRSCSLRDDRLRFPHGLTFDRSGKILYCADAGSPAVFVFVTTDDWRSDVNAADFAQTAVDSETISKTLESVPEAHRQREGGVKGFDLHPAGRVLAATCKNQPFAFFETVKSPNWCAFSCVVDDVPAIWESIVPWLATVTTLARVHPTRIYIHHVCPLPSWLAQLCERLGVNVRPIEPFDPQYPHANKIAQCRTDFGDAETVVLCDVDVAFAMPLPIGNARGVVAGKLVDRANPPIETLHAIFAEAGIVPMDTCSNTYAVEREEATFETVLGNFNGGLYLVPRSELPALGAAWAHWGRWLAGRPDILDEWRTHLDQVAFCLALNERRLPMRVLDDRWNYPTHLEVRSLSERPFALHHHAALDGELRLSLVTDPMAKPAIHAINQAIKGFRRAYRESLERKVEKPIPSAHLPAEFHRTDEDHTAARELFKALEATYDHAALEALCRARCRLLLSDPNAAAAVVAADVCNALRQRTPWALARIGDGEGTLLSTILGGFPRRTTRKLAAVQLHQQTRAFVTPAQIDRFAEDLWVALYLCDVLGFRGLDTTGGRSELDGVRVSLFDKDDVRGAVGQMAAREFLMRSLKRDAFAAKTLTSAWIYAPLLTHLDDMIGAANRLVIVSGIPELELAFRARYGDKLAEFITVPKEATEHDAAESHISRYPSLVKRVECASSPGTLVLVGAGVFGKMYCAAAKRGRAVAVDLGSGFDLLAGKRTRPVHRQFDVDALCWHALSG